MFIFYPFDRLASRLYPVSHPMKGHELDKHKKMDEWQEHGKETTKAKKLLRRRMGKDVMKVGLKKTNSLSSFQWVIFAYFTGEKKPYDQILISKLEHLELIIFSPANDQNQLLIHTSIIKLSYLGFILQPAVTVACILSLSYYCWIMRCTLCHFYSSDYWNKLEALLFSCPFLW